MKTVIEKAKLADDTEVVLYHCGECEEGPLLDMRVVDDTLVYSCPSCGASANVNEDGGALSPDSSS